MASDPHAESQKLADGLRHLAQALNDRGIAYALIGGVALGFRSRPRYTEDLDFILNIPQIALPGLLEELQTRGFKFDLQRVLVQWRQDQMTVLDYDGVRIDWLRPALPLYQHVIDQARPEPWLGTTMRIAAPEGLILTKLIANRAQDLADIEALVAANRASLDLDWIRTEWCTVAEESDPRFLRFQSMLKLQDEQAQQPSAATPPAGASPS